MDKLQHVQLPNNMTPLLRPQDLLVYVSIKRHMNKDTKEAFPSLQLIAEHCGASIPTIRKCIKNLEEGEYIEVIKKGRKQYYRFLKYTNFEPFSYEFLDNKNISFTEKAYQLASQQYQFKENNYGKISMTNKELSEKINMSESTISRCNKSLEEKGYLHIAKARKQGSGIVIDEKFFHLDELGQAIVFTLQNHEERINQNTEDIQLVKKENEMLREENKSMKKDQAIMRRELKDMREELNKLKNPNKIIM